MRLGEIVFDCRHPAALARFWAEVLDGFEVRAYDEREIARLAARGLTPETDDCVMVDGPGLELGFQLGDPQRGGKVPIHLDVASDRRDDDVARLVALGATVVERFETHTWLQDPEGNDFCVTGAA